MSETEGRGGHEDHGRYQDFILQRELAEVYLLLDHLSGSATKDLDTASGTGPEIPASLLDEGADWIQAVCEIAWPPPASPEQQAREISILIRVRDYLNRKAAPASGATIAFSLLVAGEASSPRNASPQSPQTAIAGRGGWGGREPPSRVELANLAFPTLGNSAVDFRKLIVRLSFGLFILLSFTCVLSWNVAAGKGLLTQYQAAQNAKAQVDKQIDDATGGFGSANASSPGSTAGAPAAPSPLPVTSSKSRRPAGKATPTPNAQPQPKTASTQPIVSYCERPLVLGPVKIPEGSGASATIRQYDSPAQEQLCSSQQHASDLVFQTRQNLYNWGTPWSWLHWPAQYAPCHPTGCLADNNEPWVANLIGVLAVTVLPIFYGLLGAAAAVVRSLSARIKESVLAPRDWSISLIQLALGAVIGACIGLFINSGDATAQGSTPGLLGTVQLSGSALSFIAGFFVEGVFVALEGLMRRVFNIEDPTRKPTAATAK